MLEIWIGETEVERDEEAGLTHKSVADAEQAGAPEIGSAFTGKRNCIAFPAGQFQEFSKEVGLGDLFDRHLLRLDYAPLRPTDLLLVREALEAYRDARKFGRFSPGAEQEWGDWEEGCLARLAWFEWWMTWALETCERPAIYCAV
jgi:hypothetical protein